MRMIAFSLMCACAPAARRELPPPVEPAPLPPDAPPAPPPPPDLGQRAAGASRWSWPAPEAFAEAWLRSAGPDTRPVPLIEARVYVVPRVPLDPRLRGRLRAHPDPAGAAADAGLAPLGPVTFAVMAEPGGVSLQPISLADDAHWDTLLEALYEEGQARVFAAPLRPLPALLKDEDHLVVLDIQRRSPDLPARPDDWAQATYAHTLLGFEGPVYPEEVEIDWRSSEPANAAASLEALRAATQPGAADRAAQDAAVAALLDTPVSAHSWTWAEAIELCTSADRPDLALRLYARFRPVGRCSMDSSPQAHAAAYAALCHAEGRTSCFLQLELRRMQAGFGFSRTAWSSYGEASFQPEPDSLTEAGVELLPFFSGLLLQYQEPQDPPVPLSLAALGRAMAASAEAPALLGALRARAEDPGLDAWNRLRAVVALSGAGWTEAELLALDLEPFSRSWVERSLAP